MTVDWDGKIRMDPSSPYAMARLIDMRSDFDLALGNDADADRFGVVTPSAGLMNPNHVLAAAVGYLFGGGREWAGGAAIGKTLVSSSMIDRVAASLGRDPVRGARRLQVVRGRAARRLGRVRRRGERRACRSCAATGGVWSTDKDGIIACLLAAEMTARTGRDPSAQYEALTARHGAPVYRRVDTRATPEEKAALGALEPVGGRGDRRSRASRSPRSSRTRPATARRSAGSRSSRTTAGSRRGRRAPRTSPSSTRSHSAARSTSTRSSRTRRRSSATRRARARVWRPRTAKIAFIGSHGIRKTTAARLRDGHERAGRSVSSRARSSGQPARHQRSATARQPGCRLAVRRSSSSRAKAECLVRPRRHGQLPYYLRASLHDRVAWSRSCGRGRPRTTSSCA